MKRIFPSANTAPITEEIFAKFSNGDEVNYTMQSFNLLITDPDVEYVCSAVTGELYYYKGM